MKRRILLLLFIINGIVLYGSNLHLAQLESLFNSKQTSNLHKTIDSIYTLNGANKKVQLKILELSIPELIRLNQYDYAIRYAHLGVDITKGTEFDSAHANFLKQIGNIEYYQFNFLRAIEAYEIAVKFAHLKQVKTIEASCYNNLGAILLEQFNYKDSEIYLKKSISISEKIAGNSRNLLMSKRLLATLYTRIGEDNKAIDLYKTITKIAQEIKDTTLMCANLVYYAELLMNLNHDEEALQKSEEALILARELDNSYSLHAALASHAEILLKLNKHEKLGFVYREIVALQKVIYAKETQKQVNELETKFKVKNIEQEKLLLKNENELKKAEIIQAKAEKQFQMLLFLGIILLFLIIGFGYYYWKKNKDKIQQANYKRRELESIIEAQELERIKIAKDLHDGIIQDLTVLKFNIKHLERELGEPATLGFQNIENGLSSAMRELRSISHQMMPVALRAHGLVGAIGELLERSFSPQKISFDYTHFENEVRFSENVELSIYRICQELINNVLKHSEAKHIVIVLRQAEGQLLFIFEDDGKGFEMNIAKQGLGLESLQSRVDLLNGTIQINSSIGNGTSVFIKIPVDITKSSV